MLSVAFCRNVKDTYELFTEQNVSLHLLKFSEFYCKRVSLLLILYNFSKFSCFMFFCGVNRFGREAIYMKLRVIFL